MHALPHVKKIAFLAAGSATLGGFLWLWASEGANVYYGYLAGAFFACL